MTAEHRPERIRALIGEYAAEFRKTALPMHDGEVAVEDVVRSLDLELLRFSLPQEFNDTPLMIGSDPLYVRRISESVIVQEELSWGDAGLMLAMPWASLAAFVIDQMAGPEIRESHYSRLANNAEWTYFAVTEPEHGSDPVSMETTLSRDDEGWVINGTKRYVGQGHRGTTGLVFCRREGTSGPMGLEVVLVGSETAGFTSAPLQTIGLRGAGLSELNYDSVRVPDDHVLGQQGKSTRRGLFGASHTFDMLRPGVGAMALGVARAAYDYVRAERRALRAEEEASMESIRQRILGTRSLIAAAARAVDAGKPSGPLSSAAKLEAVRLAEDATVEALRLLGPCARLEHPLLDKFRRDAQGFEYMEGMTDIQRQNAAQGYLTNRFWTAPTGLHP
ncbi:acyl-CoA dehydrogenase family protein [Glycomyces xiaoerkulensis]|uniref:acyl-CoA dehydrogenase family protein n=1 Tax=Glycomyces xiaoerkulensis TaxID=2038139 RepID=UPI000C25E4B9|nr:acyl-CoA dehydrogenase [Glycomyces xiaoerkulensis]